MTSPARNSGGSGKTTLAVESATQLTMDRTNSGRFLDSSNKRLYIDRWLQQRQLWTSLRAGFTARDPHDTA
jgi:hypothetical protein